MKYDDDNPPPSAKEVQRKRMLKALSCTFCPPHRNENSGRVAKRGVQQPKYKNKRPNKGKNK